MFRSLDYPGGRACRRAAEGGSPPCNTEISTEPKFPKSTADLVKPAVSYTTSPLSEYVGSHVYDLLGIPAHKTVLGVRAGKVVVGCRDLCAPGEQLVEFKKIKNSLVDEDPVDEASSSSPSLGSPVSSGRGTDLAEVLYTVRASEDLQAVPGVKERF